MIVYKLISHSLNQQNIFSQRKKFTKTHNRQKSGQSIHRKHSTIDLMTEQLEHWHHLWRQIHEGLPNNDILFSLN